MSSTIIIDHPAFGGDVTGSPPALLTTLFPLPKPIVQHGLLIQAIAARKSVVAVAGVQVNSDLTLHNTPSDNSTSSSKDDTTSSGEFVARGTIELFGNKDVTAEFDIWHGSPPLCVTIGLVSAPFIFKGSVKLSQFIPSLNEASLGVDLSLQNVSIYHQNYLYDPTKTPQSMNLSALSEQRKSTSQPTNLPCLSSHMQKVLKVQCDSRLSFVDVLSTLLDPTESDSEGYCKACILLRKTAHT